MKNIIKFLTAALFVFLFTTANAQETLKLTVDQAVSLGLQNSKTLHASLMKVNSADARLKEVFASRLPSLKLQAAYRRLSEVDPFIITTPFGTFPIAPSILNNYSAQLMLTQPLFTGFKLSSSNDIAEYSYDAAGEDYKKDSQELVFNIKNAYWNLFKANEMKKVLDEIVNQTKAHLTDAQNLSKAGMLTNNDVLKIQVQLSDVLYKQVDAENAVQLANLALNNLMSIPLETRIELTSSTEYSDSRPADLSELISTAVKSRPEIKSADFKIKAAESGVTLAKGGWYPQIALVGNYYYSRPNQRIVPSEDKFNATWDVGVSLSMDLWNWLTTSHQTEQAESALIQSKDAMGSIRDAVTLEVTQNYLNVKQAGQKISISQLAVKQAEENHKVFSERFKNGMALSSDLIDAEVAELQARINYTSSIVDYEVAKAKLEKSIGSKSLN